MEIAITPVTRPLCHMFYQGFENNPDIFMDMSRFAPYEYTPEWADRYFEKQRAPDRLVFMIMEGGRPVGEVKLKYIDHGAKQCSLGIHLQNDCAKNRGIGTAAERLALEYAFNVLGMEVVNADVVLKNKRSQHVLEKVGFVYVREDGAFRYYACKRP